MDKITFLFWAIGLQCVIIAGLTVAFLRVQKQLTDARIDRSELWTLRAMIGELKRDRDLLRIRVKAQQDLLAQADEILNAATALKAGA